MGITVEATAHWGFIIPENGLWADDDIENPEDLAEAFEIWAKEAMGLDLPFGCCQTSYTIDDGGPAFFGLGEIRVSSGNTIALDDPPPEIIETVEAVRMAAKIKDSARWLISCNYG